MHRVLNVTLKIYFWLKLTLNNLGSPKAVRTIKQLIFYIIKQLRVTGMIECHLLAMAPRVT